MLTVAAVCGARALQRSDTPGHLYWTERPALSGAFTPLVRRFVASYESDPWFATAANTAGMTKSEGLWLRNGKVAVPADPSLRSEILSALHASVWAGHFGVYKTLHAVQRQFCWPGLKQDVEHFCSHCDTCQRNKPRSAKSPGKLMPLPMPGARWNSVGLDFVVSLPRTERGHDAVCTFVDRLTKMAHLIPCTSDCDAVDTANLFIQNVFKLHGIPGSLVTDRGTQFISAFFSTLTSILGVQQLMSTAYHAQTDGQTERTNRIMEDCLRHFVSANQDNWDMLLPMVEFAINNAVQESTRETPFFLNYGMHPQSPFSIQLPVFHSESPSAHQFAQTLDTALQHARKCLNAAQQRQKAYADKHRSDVKFSVGQYVLLSSKNINLKHSGSRKLLPLWLGPYQIVQQINPVAFKLQLPTNMSRLHPVFHVSLLKPYRSTGIPPTPPPILLDDGDVAWSVEALLKDRWTVVNRKRVHQFLVKWSGFGVEHNSWVAESDILDPALISAYKAKTPQQPAPPPKKHVKRSAPSAPSVPITASTTPVEAEHASRKRKPKRDEAYVY